MVIGETIIVFPTIGMKKIKYENQIYVHGKWEKFIFGCVFREKKKSIDFKI